MLIPVKEPAKQSLKKYKFSNVLLCPPLRKEFENIAVRRILGDVLKILLSLVTSEFVQQRHRMDIPNGMFGLKLDAFYERCRIDDVYLNVLSMICKESLQKAKFIIVLDDLREFIKNLITAYTTNNMGPVVQEIANSCKLLSIQKIITESYIENREKVEIVSKSLKEHTLRKTGILSKMDGLVYAAMNKLAESILITNKMEYRTHTNYNTQIVNQHIYLLSKAEEDIEEDLNRIKTADFNEALVYDSIVRRQTDEITFLKEKIQKQSQKFDKECEYYDGRLAYNRNSIELMKKRLVDCTLALAIFATEMPKLIQWDNEREDRERARVLAEIAKGLSKKKRKKAKAKEQALTDLSTDISKKLDEMEKKEARKEEVAKRLMENQP